MTGKKLNFQKKEFESNNRMIPFWCGNWSENQI